MAILSSKRGTGSFPCRLHPRRCCGRPGNAALRPQPRSLFISVLKRVTKCRVQLSPASCWPIREGLTSEQVKHLREFMRSPGENLSVVREDKRFNPARMLLSIDESVFTVYPSTSLHDWRSRMFKKFLLSSVCVAALLCTASEASAFHHRHHRHHHRASSYGCGSYGYSNCGYSVPACQNYYSAPSYGHGGSYRGYGYRTPSYYRSPVSIGIGGSPYGYRSGYGGYGLGGYSGYGYGRSGMSLGLSGYGRGW